MRGVMSPMWNSKIPLSPLLPLSLSESTRVINTRGKSPAPLPQFADSAQFHLSTFLQATSVAGCRKVEFPAVYLHVEARQKCQKKVLQKDNVLNSCTFKNMLITPLPRLECEFCATSVCPSFTMYANTFFSRAVSHNLRINTLLYIVHLLHLHIRSNEKLLSTTEFKSTQKFSSAHDHPVETNLNLPPFCPLTSLFSSLTPVFIRCR